MSTSICASILMTPHCGDRMKDYIFIDSILRSNDSKAHLSAGQQDALGVSAHTTRGAPFSTVWPSETSFRRTLHGLGATTDAATSFSPNAFSYHVGWLCVCSVLLLCWLSVCLLLFVG